MKEIIIEIITWFIRLGIMAGLGYLLTYLTNKIGIEKLNKYYGWVKIAVDAVEQMVGSGAGALKKQQVIDYIVGKFGGKINEVDLNMLIEAAVSEMNKVLKDKGLETVTNTVN